MSVAIRVLRGEAIAAHVPDLAALRIAVFRDWPYLYAGDVDYERRYLAGYAAPGSVVVGAFDGDVMVGAATGGPLERHDDVAPLADAAGRPASGIYYLAESVLLPDHRGEGIGHAFFDKREAEARAQGRGLAMFCAVVRPDDHPARPRNARDLHPFWRARGYAPVKGAVAALSWRDVGEAEETPKRMQAWTRVL